MKHKTNRTRHGNNEEGFVLVGAVLILMLLIVIGIIATTNTSLELQIAGNDRVHKETFYQADGGTQLIGRILEESIGASGPFSSTSIDATTNQLKDPTLTQPVTDIVIFDTNLAANGANRDENDFYATPPARDIAFYPGGYNAVNPDDSPHTNIIVDGNTGTTAGFGLQMMAGAAGLGRAAASGGTQILFTMYSQHIGRSNSESVIGVQYRHIVGQELIGRY